MSLIQSLLAASLEEVSSNVVDETTETLTEAILSANDAANELHAHLDSSDRLITTADALSALTLVDAPNSPLVLAATEAIYLSCGLEADAAHQPGMARHIWDTIVKIFEGVVTHLKNFFSKLFSANKLKQKKIEEAKESLKLKKEKEKEIKENTKVLVFIPPICKVKSSDGLSLSLKYLDSLSSLVNRLLVDGNFVAKAVDKVTPTTIEETLKSIIKQCDKETTEVEYPGGIKTTKEAHFGEKIVTVVKSDSSADSKEVSEEINLYILDEALDHLKNINDKYIKNIEARMSAIILSLSAIPKANKDKLKYTNEQMASYRKLIKVNNIILGNITKASLAYTNALNGLSGALSKAVHFI